MNPFVWLVYNLLNAYFYVILATVILSWLMAFNIVNASNQYVRQFAILLRRLTEPLLRPIRNMLPNFGGIDISPIVLLFALQAVQYFVVYYGTRLL